MRVVVTGGAGFLGHRLARALLARGRLAGAPISRVVTLDLAAPEGLSDPRLEVVQGDVADEEVLRRVLAPEAGAVFHLAAVVSAQAEADYDLGMRVNLDATRRLLDACRALPRPPRLVFASSVAVYGGALPDPVTDDTPLRPQSSYGAEKAMGELLVSDATRRGFVDGRIVRLPTISVRPGRPNRAASSFASGIIREPLQGEPAICPVTAATRLWLLSPRRAVESLALAAELPGEALGALRALNLPGVSVTVAEMLDALEAAGGREAVARVRFEPDAVVQRIVGGWPARWDATRAARLGFAGDPDFAAIVRAFVEDDLSRPA